MTDVIWSPEARVEFRKQIAHIAKDNPYAARRVQQRIEIFASDLATLSKRGTRGSAPDTYECVIPGLQYTLVYEATREVVYILRLWHQKRSRKDEHWNS